jgi:hypothetical protein
LKVGKNSIGRDLGLLPPNRVKLAARDSSDVSGAGSEADSLLELYGNNTTQRNGTSGGRRGDDSRINGDPYLLDDEDPESSRWIHRDKLARIEIEEMQRAGIYLGPDVQRPLNRLAPELKNEAGNHLRDRPADPDARALDQKRPSAEPNQGQGAADESMSFELRRPEEAAADSREEREARASQARRLVRKSSWSKIPVLKSSPAPVPKDYIERHTPAPRNRTGVWGSADEDSITYRKARSRSHSVGSQVLLDDAAEGGGGGGGGGGGSGGGSGSGGRRSPTPGPRVSSLEASAKNKNAGRPPSSSHGLRTSGSRNVSGPNRLRTQPGSKESPGQRPNTRSGETPPKTAIKRPEGDPPWLATMYKPDPRLPPEQQLIPTVAKRLLQEQWEREGKPPSLRGPDFGSGGGLEAEETNAQSSPSPSPAPAPAPQPPPQSQPQPPSPTVTPAPAPAPAPEPATGGAQKRADEAEWPLKSPTTAAAPANTAGGADSPKPSHDPPAGYTVTSGIQQQPPGDTAKPNAVTPAPPVEPLRIQPASDEKEAKAGCKCCIVM